MVIRMSKEDWINAIKLDRMPMYAYADDMLDLDSSLIYNYVERCGLCSVIFVNGYYYYGTPNSEVWKRCDILDKQNPAMFKHNRSNI